MAITKKGSRKINVNGIDYRWTLANRPKSLGQNYPSPKIDTIQCRKIVIELKDVPVSQAQIIYFYEAELEYGWPDIIPKVGILPKLIEALIKESLEKGWDPKVKGNIEFIKFEKNIEHLNPNI